MTQAKRTVYEDERPHHVVFRIHRRGHIIYQVPGMYIYTKYAVVIRTHDGPRDKYIPVNLYVIHTIFGSDAPFPHVTVVYIDEPPYGSYLGWVRLWHGPILSR